MNPASATLLTAVLVAAGAAPAHAEPRLAPHRAVYELTLLNARETGGVRAVSGRIAMEAREKTCGDFELTYRQVMRMAPDEGEANVIDFRSTTSESLDGARFTFDNTTLINGAPDATVVGKGERAGRGAGQVALTKPQARTVDLPEGAVFPTQHLRLVLDAARKGRSTVAVPVYDGADPGDVTTDTVAFIGEARAADPQASELLAKAKAGEARVWPVSIGYFETGKPAHDQAPKFLYSADLMDNGITPHVRLDYGSFVVDGRLVELDMLPSGCR